MTLPGWGPHQPWYMGHGSMGHGSWAMGPWAMAGGWWVGHGSWAGPVPMHCTVWAGPVGWACTVWARPVGWPCGLGPWPRALGHGPMAQGPVKWPVALAQGPGTPPGRVLGPLLGGSWEPLGQGLGGPRTPIWTPLEPPFWGFRAYFGGIWPKKGSKRGHFGPPF